jgi:hypothetical protein
MQIDEGIENIFMNMVLKNKTKQKFKKTQIQKNQLSMPLYLGMK